MNYNVNNENERIIIGEVGENLAESCTIDYSAWVEEYGEGNLRIRAIREGDAEPYPVANVETADGVATWTYTAADTAVKGFGEVQVLYYVGDVLAKSRVWKTYTYRSLNTSSEEVPDPYADWLNAVERIGGQVEADAEAASASADSASASATLAAGSASEAAESALSAARSESSAQEYASEASTSATSAASSASAASQSASEASTYEYYSEQYMNEAKSARFSAESAKNAAETAKTAAQTAATESEASATAAAQSAEQAEETAESIEESADLIQKLMDNQIKDTATGTIATYPDGADMPMVSLIADIDPIQDTSGGAPWIGTDHDNTPYLRRAMPTQSNDYNRETDMLVGGTVVWNQLLPDFDASNWSLTANVTSVSDGELHVQPTATWQGATKTDVSVIAGHKYFESCVGRVETSGTSVSIGDGLLGVHTIGNIYSTSNTTIATIVSATATITGNYNVGNRTGVANYYLSKPQLIDLTAMFGTTIADYIYSLEQANAGAGVAWFRQYFQKSYYPYDPGTLRSVEGVSAHETVGFNQWDEEWDNGWWNYQTGVFTASSSFFACKSKIAVFPNTKYYWKCPTNVRELQYYDANGEPLGRRNSYAEGYANTTFTTPDGCYYLTFYFGASYGTTYNHDICINLSWDGERNGEYEPYVEHSYPLDDSLTLRGIPKVSNGKLYYDGDTYESDGTVTRKYGIVDLGTLDWSANNHDGAIYMTSGNIADSRFYNANVENNIICSKYKTVLSGWSTFLNGDKNINIYEKKVSVYDTAYTDAATFKTAMSGVYLVYELATPTTETAQPYTNPQIVDPDGTEEYVTANYVPVGHDSTYSLVCPISGWDEVETVVSGKNIFGGRAFADGIKTAIPQAILDTDAKTISYASGYATSTSNFTSGVRFKENTQYTIILKFSNTVDRTNVLVAYTDGTSTIIRTSRTGLQTIIFTSVTNKTINYIGGSNNNGTSVFYYEECGVFEGVLTADQFEPYTATTYTTTLPQTVYGGTLDVVSGVLTVDRAMVDLGTLTWSDGTDSVGKYFKANIPDIKPAPSATVALDAICSAYPVVPSNNVVDGSIAVSSGGGKTVYARDFRFSDVASFTTGVNGVQFCYPLDTPISLNIDAQQIDSLLGRNSVWADSGDVTVEYIADTKLYIQKVIS